ncbi:MAG: DUF2812 domain-containing protein [Oscillospiraceae bacterium]
MRKKVVRYFFGFIESQQKWLNTMAQKGYRLIATGKLIYEFEICKPSEFQYCVDFVAEKSDAELNNYKAFLKEMGYKVFSKNINLNWSFGKVTYRPYGEGVGKLATSPGTYNKELLIVEKLSDGKPFELHTTAEDKLHYYRKQRNACLTLMLLGIILFAMGWYQLGTLNAGTITALALGILAGIPSFLFQQKLWKVKRDFAMSE